MLYLVISLVKFSQEVIKTLQNSLLEDDLSWAEKPPSPSRDPKLEFAEWSREDEGTNSDIYRLATRARANGHTNLIFLDGKSAKDLSVVVARWHSKISDDLSMRRLPAQRAILFLAFCEANGFDIEDGPAKKLKYSRQVMNLKNPFAAPFGGNCQEEEWIDNYEFDIRSLSEAPELIDFKSEEIVLISLAPNVKSEDLINEVDSNDNDSRLNFFQWSGNERATRADLYRLFNLVVFNRSWGKRPGPVAQKLFVITTQNRYETRSTHYSIIFASWPWTARPNEGVNITILPAQQLKRAWAKIYNLYKEPMVFDHELLKGQKSEVLLNPNGHMYDKEAKPWEPDEYRCTCSPPVFFLAKLSGEEEAAVKEELGTFSDIDTRLRNSGDMDEKKLFCWIPWVDRDEDGTGEDMLRIAKMTGLGNMIFVDRQSASDKTVILTYPHYEYDKDEKGNEIADTDHQHFLGLDWGRASGRKAHLSWINLDIANMGIDELVEGNETVFLPFQ